MLSNLCILLFLMFSAQDLEQCRTHFFEAENAQGIEKNYLFHEKNSFTEPVGLAYRGAALAMNAQNESMPWNKWTSFTTGKELIEKAVLEDNKNAEIRFIRMSIQCNIPSFLGYQENIEEDYEFIQKNKALDKDRSFWTKANKYLDEWNRDQNLSEINEP